MSSRFHFIYLSLLSHPTAQYSTTTIEPTAGYHRQGPTWHLYLITPLGWETRESLDSQSNPVKDHVVRQQRRQSTATFNFSTANFVTTLCIGFLHHFFFFFVLFHDFFFCLDSLSVVGNVKIFCKVLCSFIPPLKLTLFYAISTSVRMVRGCEIARPRAK